VVFSNHWGTKGRVDMHFPTQQVQTIWAHGSFPLGQFHPWTKLLWQPQPDPVARMQKVIDGRWDADLVRWLEDAKATGIPMMVDFGVETNGAWFPWNGKWNGHGTTDGYGDPAWPDGPERFRDAYRHVIDLSRRPDVGADNITWSFHVDTWSRPNRAWWNKIRYYYPANNYIDWLGLSAYGEQVPTGDPSDWETFREIMGDPGRSNSPYRQFVALSPTKPTSVSEFGVTEDPAAGDKAEWITGAFESIADGYCPGFDSVSYWHEAWQNSHGMPDSNLRIDSSPEALAVYRAAVASPFFVSTPVFACG